MLTSLAGALVAVACTTVLLFLVFVGYGFACRLRSPSSGDFVVVLGSTLTADGQVPPLLAARLERTREVVEALREQGGAPVMIVSGGKTPRDPVTEANAMAEYLVRAGERAEELVMEDESCNTEQNIRLSGRIMQQTGPAGFHCIIVTNDYHCPRAAVLIRRNGLSATVIGAKTPAKRWHSAVVRDFAALVVTCWKPAMLLGVVVALAAALVI